MAPLASEHTGLTTNLQPVLQWYISGPWDGEIEFSLNIVKAIEPVLETKLKGPSEEGIYQVRLADYGVSLKPGLEYEWFLAIVTEPEERSGDFLASATIRYVEPSDKLFAQLVKTEKSRRYYVYASEGYWYDAIESVSRLIDEKSDDSVLRSHRMALLQQVNIPRAVAYESRKISEVEN
jgi:hypothetical protein